MDGRSYTFSPPTVENDNQTSENSTTTLTSCASVFLPPALFKSINKTDVGIVFSVYRTASFFPIANASNTTIIASIILGASVVSGSGVSFQNLSVPVQFIFIISSKVWSSIMCKAMPVNEINVFSQHHYSRYDCVSWDFNAAGESCDRLDIRKCMQYVQSGSYEIMGRLELMLCCVSQL